MSLHDAIRTVGAAGLVNEALECSCLLRDLEPCGGALSQCRPGFLRFCACGDSFLVADLGSDRTKCSVCLATDESRLEE